MKHKITLINLSGTVETGILTDLQIRHYFVTYHLKKPAVLVRKPSYCEMMFGGRSSFRFEADFREEPVGQKPPTTLTFSNPSLPLVEFFEELRQSGRLRLIDHQLSLDM